MELHFKPLSTIHRFLFLLARLRVSGVSLVSILGVEGHFDSFNLMAEFYGWSELKVHTFLNCRKGQQQQSLSINILEEEKKYAVSINV